MRCPECEHEIDHVVRGYDVREYETVNFTDEITGEKQPPVNLDDEETLLLAAAFPGRKRTITAEWGDHLDRNYETWNETYSCPECDRDIEGWLRDHDLLGFRPVEVELNFDGALDDEEEEEEVA